MSHQLVNDILQRRLLAIEAEILAYGLAITALTSGGIQSYELDTGQTRQRVTRIDIASLQRAADGLYNELVMLNARLNGGHTIIARPCW